MSNKLNFKNVAIIGNKLKIELNQVIKDLITYFSARNINCAVEQSINLDFNVPSFSLNNKQQLNQYDLFIIAGGDGSILRYSVNLVGLKNCYILGLNIGTVGFHAYLSKKFNFELDNILAGNFSIDKKILLDVELNKIKLAKVINDIAIQDLEIISLDIKINNNHVYRITANGLVICTPTGSTAYSASCGGPIILPSSSSLCISPICPSKLSARPIVLDDNSIIKINPVKTEKKRNIIIHLDGRKINENISHKDIIQITKNNNAFLNFIIPNNWNFFKELRTKLSI